MGQLITIDADDTVTTNVLLRNGAGDEFVYAVEFKPGHRGLWAAMNRAARKPSKKGTAANGAITVSLIKQRKATS